MSDAFSLQGKNAVVTGLSGGIGQSIAETLARQGANVAGDYLSNDDGATETAGLIEAHGRESLIFQGDTGDEAHVQDLAERTVARWGSIDIWVNNAAGLLVRPIGTTSSPPTCTATTTAARLRRSGCAAPGPVASSTSPLR